MYVFKCKMCGGMLNVENGVTVAECEFCGRKQTIPKLDDDKRSNLYDRANHFRRNNDYDKAMGIYEIILNEDKTDAEAYWSILLCKYGVEYVEDPATHKRVPTINRTQFTSITKDEDYKNALKYADGYQRDIYESEAKEIDEIQQGILAISGKEEPFDVFICYKETDHGSRTIDSVLAQELYYNLKNEGFKTFFSRITLEDKLGVAYEPYIFAALNSAKVMVVIGSKTEYFNSVWVKNEWSRFLSLIRKGEKKTLIPAYKDMDPYDLPEEFSHLQAQDMSRLGFMQDLLHGIKKVIGKTASQKVVKETVVVDNHHDTTPFLRRAYLFLEDGDFDSAAEYTEKILDINPECAEAYFIKLLIEFGLQKPELLNQSEKVITESSNYKKAVRFADKKFKETLVAYNEKILENIDIAQKENVYKKAYYDMQEEYYDEAIESFSKIIDYKDSAQKVEICKVSIEKERKEAIYKKAIARVATGNINEVLLKQSIVELQEISGYKDVDEKISNLQLRLEKYCHDKKVEQEQARIRAEEERLKKERESELRKAKEEKHKQNIKKVARIGIPSILAITIVLILTFTLFVPTGKYNNANNLLNCGNYEEALKIYENLDGFSGSEAKIATINAVKTINKGSFEQGVKDALSTGATVNITYEFAGGKLNDSNENSDNSPMSCALYVEELLETEKTYTYTKIEDFTGLKSPERIGYYVQKYELVSCNVKVTSKENILNLHLVAVWSANQYVITYDLDGGSLSSPNPVGYNIGDPTFTLVNPTKTGYTFEGWIGTDLNSKTTTITIAKGTIGNKSYIANWKANNYTLTYDVNGGDEIANNIQSVTYDANYSVIEPTRMGYSFVKWIANTGTIYSGGTWKTDGNVTVIAEWEANTYTVNYNGNGGTPAKISDTATYDINFALTSASRTGYNFVCWKYNGEEFTSRKWNLTNDITLVAEWSSPLSYTITYLGNGGIPSQSTQIVTFDTCPTLATASRTGYIFKGWINGTKEYVSGSVWKTANDVVLTAEWEARTDTVYTVRHYQQNIYDDNYTIFETDNLKGKSDASITPTINTYAGFTPPKATTTTIAPDGSSVIDYYYTRNNYTIMLIANDGSNSAIVQKFGSAIDKNTCPTRDGYTFGGWFTDVTLTTEYTLTEMPAKNQTIYAWWKEENKPTDFTYIGTSSITVQAYNENSDIVCIPEYIGGIPVTNISEGAFKNKLSLVKVVVPNTVMSIGKGAFKGCNSLTDMTLPFVGNDSITEDEWNVRDVFGYIFDFTETKADNKSEPGTICQYSYSWGANYWNCYYYIPKTLRTITIAKQSELPVYAFYNCYFLQSITLPSAMTSIRGGAFDNCSSLTSIEIPDSIISIGSIAFSGCSSLTSIEIPDSVISIGERAFSGCSSLTSIEIPDSVISIGKRAFSGCSKLVEVINKSQLDITKCSEDYGYVGYYALNIKKEGKSEIVNKDDYLFYTYDDVNYLLGYVGNKTDLTLPNNYNGQSYKIYKYAFYGRSSLTSIEIPDSVTSIGYDAFYGCYKLVEVINKSQLDITKGSDDYGYVGYYALNVKTEGESEIVNKDDYLFYTYDNVSYLLGYVGNKNDLNLPNNYNGQNYKIYNYAFYNCRSLTSIEISDSVISIGKRAFFGCSSLTSISIGIRVTSIGDYAFYSCSSLTSVYYKGVAAAWSNISIGSDNSTLTKVTRYYYSETEPVLDTNGMAYKGNYWHYVDNVPTVWVYTCEE